MLRPELAPELSAPKVLKQYNTTRESLLKAGWNSHLIKSMHNGIVVLTKLAELLAAAQEHLSVDSSFLCAVGVLVRFPQHHVQPLCESMILLALPAPVAHNTLLECIPASTKLRRDVCSVLYY